MAVALFLATQSTAAEPLAYCTSKKAYCIPDGVGTMGAYGFPGCNWTATVRWGDGRKDVFHFAGSKKNHYYKHPYKHRGFWRAQIEVKGKPEPGSSAQCGGGHGANWFEYPYTVKQVGTIRGTRDLARKVPRPAKRLKKVAAKVKEQGGTKAPAELRKKGDDVVRRLVDELAKEGRERAKEWAAEKLKDSFTKKYSAAVNVDGDSLKKLWKFLGTLGDLNQWPKSAVKAADARYEKDANFREELDRLSSLAGCANDSYKQCTPEQRRGVAVSFGVIVQDGAVNQLINDAAEAAKAGTDVSFTLPGSP
jgi:hypothetical protein